MTLPPCTGLVCWARAFETDSGWTGFCPTCWPDALSNASARAGEAVSTASMTAPVPIRTFGIRRRNDRLPETGEPVAAQASLARTIPLWMAMDSAGFIAFRDERKASVCYDDPALTFGRIPERPAQQAVGLAGAILLQGRIQPVIPRRASVPSSRRPCQQGGAILVPARPPSNGCWHLYRSPVAKAGQRVHSPGIRLGPDPPVGIRPFAGSSLLVIMRATDNVTCASACALMALRCGSTHPFPQRGGLTRCPHPVHRLREAPPAPSGTGSQVR
jgi:hypothetical protein